MSLFQLESNLVVNSNCNKVECEATWKWNTVMCDYDLWYVWDGDGLLELNGVKWLLRANMCFLFKPGDTIKAYHNPDQPLVVSYLHFHGVNPGVVPPSTAAIDEDTLRFEDNLVRYVALMHNRPSYYEEEAQSILVQLMIQMLRCSKQAAESDRLNPIRRSVMKCAAYIREHPGKDISIEELARTAGFSQRYLCRKFKEYTGKSVKAYMIEARLERAEYLLRYGGMNVSEVAEALSYRDLYFFSRQFKEHRGIAPSEIKRRTLLRLE